MADGAAVRSPASGPHAVCPRVAGYAQGWPCSPPPLCRPSLWAQSLCNSLPLCKAWGAFSSLLMGPSLSDGHQSGAGTLNAPLGASDPCLG